MILVVVLMLFCMGAITIWTHAAEPIDPPELVAGASTIITEKLDAGFAISKVYKEKVAKIDRIISWKQQADVTEISETFTTATLEAINAMYGRAMAVDLSQEKAISDDFDFLINVKMKMQGFRDDAVNDHAYLQSVSDSDAFDNLLPMFRAGITAGLEETVREVDFYETPAIKEFINWKPTR